MFKNEKKFIIIAVTSLHVKQSTTHQQNMFVNVLRFIHFEYRGP